MSKMAYDSPTTRNCDLNTGVENFSQQLQHDSFSIVTGNYDFSHTAIHDKCEAYTLYNEETAGGCSVWYWN